MMNLMNLTCVLRVDCVPEAFNSILYPESSGSLTIGWSPGETLENSKKNEIFGLAAL